MREHAYYNILASMGINLSMIYRIAYRRKGILMKGKKKEKSKEKDFFCRSNWKEESNAGNFFLSFESRQRKLSCHMRFPYCVYEEELILVVESMVNSSKKHCNATHGCMYVNLSRYFCNNLVRVLRIYNLRFVATHFFNVRFVFSLRFELTNITIVNIGYNV